MRLMRRPSPRRISPLALYGRLTFAFALGLHLPFLPLAPDPARLLGAAAHNWVVIFWAPIAAWALLTGRHGRP